MLTVTTAEVTHWLESYYDAWRRADSEAASMLFTADAVYAETPYEESWPEGKRMSGRNQIADYWHWVTVELSQFLNGGYDLWAVNRNEAYARWWVDAKLRDDGYWIKAEGVLRLSFSDRLDDHLLCGQLLEWNPVIPETAHHYEPYPQTSDVNLHEDRR